MNRFGDKEIHVSDVEKRIHERTMELLESNLVDERIDQAIAGCIERVVTRAMEEKIESILGSIDDVRSLAKFIFLYENTYTGGKSCAD